MGKKKDEEESDLLGQSDTEKREAELIERARRVEEAEAKRGKGEKEEKVEKKYAPRCPKCNSTQVHIRIRDGAIVCHRCGEVTVMERSGY
jgi:ribosomal protein S27E